MNYTRFLTARSLARAPSAIRSLQKYLGIPGMISLGGGNPNPSTFPLQSMTFTLRNGETINIDEPAMQKALQVRGRCGLGELVKWLGDLQTHVHNPPKPFDVCVGNGSQDVLTKAFEMCIGDGEVMLIESPTYVGSLAFLRPLGAKFAEIDTDGEGLVPDHLEKILATWQNPATRPKILYTIPIGGNPTGASVTLERKKQVYAIAKKYDLLIIEDDPYYYLQFAKPGVPSYLSMDVDGRVLRFDSLTVLWKKTHQIYLPCLCCLDQSTLLNTSGVSQTIVNALLQRWQIPGFLSHVEGVAGFYEGKRDAFLKSANKYLTGLAEWTVPDSGMFVWLKLNGISDSSRLVREKAMEKKVLLVPGFEFFPNQKTTSYVRASYSTATAEEMDEAVRRVADLVREAQKEGTF
ncbi:pyridoxal phosphate-dependent transferase [Blyttiomyces helicus]|uniref:Pyridoxal phosphate-dependent transferase n=1 Tax=Blyttiomyces helicus TaxID=388810 RepID=A0A4P9W3G0_9FUNG|nr:pyridoxal phosphate-dependent transferase [Blyttiomyces helicus]|eukprot:RKO84666.1 pyridoxal phosphate-dependent transferase [Blyttiomyces helicus]